MANSDERPFERLGILADIHGNALALAAVLHDARQRHVRRFVNLGDIFYGPLDPRGTLELLQQTNIVATIAGNQDRYIFEANNAACAANQTLAYVHAELGEKTIGWLRGLPSTCVLDGDLFLCHGTPLNDTVYLLEDVAAGYPTLRSDLSIDQFLGGVTHPIVLCGHSHIARLFQVSKERLVINPGSIGLPAYEDDLPVKHRMESCSPHASYAVLEKNEYGWNVAFQRVPYDWNAAAEQALLRNREDWAQGILTGRVLFNNPPAVRSGT